MISVLPVRSSISFYGFLSGAEEVTFPSAIFMMKDTVMKRFSNFDSPTVRDQQKLINMLNDLEHCIENLLFRTRVGQHFKLSEFEVAMKYKGATGGKAVLIPNLPA